MSRKQTPESFWQQVAIDDLEKCWPWVGAVNDGGYGIVSWHGTVYLAHRIAAWLLGFVTHPAGPADRAGSGFVLHSCDYPRCCNPTHFDVSTLAQNQREAYERGLRVPLRGGLTHPNAKLLPEEVLSIRASADRQMDLAATYGVSQRAISLIKRRESYAWIS